RRRRATRTADRGRLRRAGTRASCKSHCKEQAGNNETRPTIAFCSQWLRSTPRVAAFAPLNKKPGNGVSSGLLGTALVSTLFWKILVTRFKVTTERPAPSPPPPPPPQLTPP